MHYHGKMVAVIKVGMSIDRMLNYNEKKLLDQKAICLYSGNYPVDSDRLNFRMKQSFMQRRMELNTNASRNSLHISLNFDTSENGLANEKMTDIARAYMDGLGFGEQPYLVYRHFDAGHPHLHIVTTNIRDDGSRIDLHHLAIRKSEPTRKKLEEDFGLVRAERHKKDTSQRAVRVAEYGKLETKAAIQNVLDAVLDKYRYASLSEFNAVLSIYNIRADQGEDGSRVRVHRGLLYRIVSDTGEPLGVPVKASLFHSQPTLKRLEVKFARNAITSGAHKARIKNAIDRLGASGKPLGFHGLVNAMASQGITVIQRRNEQGNMYGLTYVDHQTGGVFNGSALGKAYSAKQMLERFPEAVSKPTLQQGAAGRTQNRLERLASQIAGHDPSASALLEQIAGILKTLTQTEFTADYLPTQFARKKKRRKRGHSGNI